MQPLLSNRFQAFQLEQGELEVAIAVSPYTYAYLQNKVANYASQVVEFSYDTKQDLTAQVIQHENLKACVAVLEELLNEFIPPQEANASNSNFER